MESFILASSNSHKAEEFSTLFAGKLEILPAPSSLEVDESGKTFIENAFLKASSYYEKFKTPTLADDSGLVVVALPDILGVQSARFAPELPNYQDKCQRLLTMLSPNLTRDAYFVCVLCFFLSPEEVYFFEGRVKGHIGKEIMGEHGFGYDPIFIPERKENDSKTLAELPEWKNEFSHRARAAQSAMQFFKERIDKIRQKS